MSAKISEVIDLIKNANEEKIMNIINYLKFNQGVLIDNYAIKLNKFKNKWGDFSFGNPEEYIKNVRTENDEL